MSCAGCGSAVPAEAKFCPQCGTRLSPAGAEYKQVTVLFADVVQSMDIASTIDTERLRDIMADLVGRASRVVRHYSGIVDKFTGDGIMALFGAPAALEDHAVRACLAAVGIQREASDLAAELRDRDGLELALRIGLSSGEVIVGDVGASSGYTAIGHHVGMAQRMESVAPPGGILLSDSTARLAERKLVLRPPELVQVKGFATPVSAHRLDTAITYAHPAIRQTTFVGRKHELAAIADALEDHRGGVITIVGEPGIGKSRLAAEATLMSKHRGADVFSAYCESHSVDIPFYAVTQLFREAFGVAGLQPSQAREQTRSALPDADPLDLELLDDLLGISETPGSPTDIDPDARRRRLERLVSGAAMTRAQPATYVLEDAHWIDDVSESMFAGFVSAIAGTGAVVIITYRPEYRGPLAEFPDRTAISLAPLTDPEIATLATALLGGDASVANLIDPVVDRAAGNPFFAEEIVRDLAERKVVGGTPGRYTRRFDAHETVVVPPTLKAAIGARIDRLESTSKRILGAGSVIGTRFDAQLVAELIDTGTSAVHLAGLVEANLVDPVVAASDMQYAFHHPLIRSVAYEAQLRSNRAELHRRLAAAIERRSGRLVDENAALIAEHLEAAGDLDAGFGWHLRAAGWSTNRDLGAARTSWQRAKHVADMLPDDHPGRPAMRIIPRSLLCASTWRAGGTVADAGFEELRMLCNAAGDQRSLAIGMSGHIMELTVHNLHRESAALAGECAGLLESIGDPELIVGLLYATVYSKYEAGEVRKALQLVQRVIDLADGNPAMGNLVTGSPLAMALGLRALLRTCLGISGWREDFAESILMAREFDPSTRVLAVTFKYVFPVPNGMLLPTEDTRRETAEALDTAERLGDDFVLGFARLAHGANLVQRLDEDRDIGFELLDNVRETTAREGFALTAMPVVDIGLARDSLRAGDVEAAIGRARLLIESMYGTGEMIWHGPAHLVLVESLLHRRSDGDLEEAEAAIDRLAAVPVDPGFVLHELPLLRLRALTAQARSDTASYRRFRDHYRATAGSLGFEGHLAMASAMP